MNLAGAEVELVSMMSREQRLKEKLDVLSAEYSANFPFFSYSHPVIS